MIWPTSIQRCLRIGKPIDHVEAQKHLQDCYAEGMDIACASVRQWRVQGLTEEPSQVKSCQFRHLFAAVPGILTNRLVRDLLDRLL